MKVEREGKTIDIPVTLKSESGSLATAKNVIIYGATFQRITQNEKNRFHLDDGFQITRLDNGVFKSSGIREGFIVTTIDKQPVHSTQELKEALTSKRGGILVEGIYPNGLRAYYGIGL